MSTVQRRSTLYNIVVIKQSLKGLSLFICIFLQCRPIVQQAPCLQCNADPLFIILSRSNKVWKGYHCVFLYLSVSTHRSASTMSTVQRKPTGPPHKPMTYVEQLQKLNKEALRQQPGMWRRWWKKERIVALRPHTLKHIRGGWSHYTSEPVDGYGVQNMVTVQSGFQTRDLSIAGPMR
jgi:hypothetical protein